MNIISIFRPFNLFIVALTIFLIYIKIVIPTLFQWADPSLFSPSGMIYMIVMSLCSVAAGYIINDIYDIKTDAINKPTEKKIVGNAISIANAQRLYYIVLGIGLAETVLLYQELSQPFWIYHYFIINILLWAYSKKLKGTPVIGNFLVAFLCAEGVLIPLVAIYPFIEEKIFSAGYIAFLYAGFSFLSHWLRETIKDIEDVAGDTEMNLNTLPVKYGKTTAIKIADHIGHTLLVGLVLSIIYFWRYENNGLALYLSVAVLFPLLYFLNSIPTLKEKKDFSLASSLLKIIMFLGLLSLVFY